MGYSNEVVNKEVLAKLPRASCDFRYDPDWFVTLYCCLLDRSPLYVWRSMFFLRTRMANCVAYELGPFCVVRPARWLYEPARRLHPEAFADHGDS